MSQNQDQLEVAAKKGDLESLKVLLSSKASSKASSVDSLLRLACVNGHRDIVSFLIKKKNANVNASFFITYEGDGVTFYHDGEKSLLMETVESGHAAIVKQLVVKHRANVDFKNCYGQSVLNVACKKGNTEIVEVLLAHSKQTDDQQVMYSLLETAIENDHTEIVSCLLQRGAKIINEKRGLSALNTACKRGSTNMVKFILENGGSPHVSYIERISGGRSALMEASNGGSCDKIELFLRYKADINAVNSCGDFPLLLAINKKSPRAVEVLIKGGANVNQIHEKGTLLMMVIRDLRKEQRQNVIDILRKLLDSGADVNIEDEVKNTALFEAVKIQSQKYMKWVIDKGAQVNHQNRDGKSPLMFAASYNNWGINNLLLEKGAKIDLQDELQQTPLMVAASSGHTDLVQLYLDKGADVNVQDSQGNYALLSAIEKGCYEISDLLLKRGANAKLLRVDGKSAANILEEQCIKQGLHLKEDLIEMNNALLNKAKAMKPANPTPKSPWEPSIDWCKSSKIYLTASVDIPVLIPASKSWERGSSESEEEQAINYRYHKDSKGIAILCKSSVKVTNLSQSFHWKEYGLKLNIPAQSLPDEIKTCEITITVSLSGQYKFPEGTELVSPVFCLSCEPNCSFTHPLSLEIEHCALPENIDSLSIARASLTQKELPYSFEILDGGCFSQTSSFGVITVNSFSIFAVIQKLFKTRRYWYDVFDIINQDGAGKDIHFAITWDDSAHIKRVKDEYTDLGAQPHNIGQPIAFEEDKISLKVSDEGITSGGWKIYPDFPPIISKTTVDHSASIPHCVLKARWQRHGLEVEPLTALKIYIQGTNQESNYFTIDSPGQAVVTMENRPSHPEVVPPTSLLTERDQPKIRHYLSQLGNQELVEVGMSLGLSSTWLNRRSLSDSLINDMVISWLRRDGNVLQQSGPPSLESLCRALEECHYNGIASDIRRNEEVN